MLTRSRRRPLDSAEAVIVIGLLMFSCSTADAQFVTPQATPAAVSKDARATSMLTQMLAVTGWSRQAALNDVVLAGTITRHLSDGSATAAFTMKLRGEGQYDYSENGGVRLVANGAAGAIVGTDGKAHRIPSHSALSSGTLILPMSATVLDWNARDVDLAVVGETSVAGEKCVGVRLARRHPDSDSDRFAKVRRLVAPITLWISATRSLPLKAEYYRISADNHNATQRETALFSDYRNVNGIALPFREEISVEDDPPMYTFEFSSAQWNQGLSDADFDVARVAGGVQ